MKLTVGFAGIKACVLMGMLPSVGWSLSTRVFPSLQIRVICRKGNTCKSPFWKCSLSLYPLESIFFFFLEKLPLFVCICPITILIWLWFVVKRQAVFAFLELWSRHRGNDPTVELKKSTLKGCRCGWLCFLGASD